ncbi:DUF4347 domain-containing protein [Mesorhizobium erdmanii]|uniref:DUF4347 domain-containing protein n=1 Tax=Mesorhizobium erdmanii TaxID=1777866 RepID=A0A6M7URV9_9HYPH|nr:MULTISPECIES: DUF4347 domain-containing protein [Mesorhizobium]QKC78798.1 DUF4347 domain-containing protein [Mesorhizobium erdmanii]
MSVLRRKADVPIPKLTREFAVETSAARVMGVGVVNQVLSRVPRGGVVPRFDGRQIHPLPAAAPDRPNARADAPRPRPSELLFVDPSVSDLGTILANLRPQVEAIVLDAARPAARQIALALEGRDDLDAVHVIAHGAPGRVSFAAGEWSARTLDDDAVDLAAIGQALDGLGELLLWSCNAGAGAAGTDFIDALARAAGAPVAAANNLIGAPALGGDWKLNVRTTEAAARPPLTRGGVMNYAAVLAVPLTSTGQGERLNVFGQWPAGTAAGTYFIVLNDGGTLNVIGQFIVPTNFGGTFAISEALPAGRYTVGPSAPGPSTIAVYNGRWSSSGNNAGTWSVGDFNPAISATLNKTGDVTPNQADRGAAR